MSASNDDLSSADQIELQNFTQSSANLSPNTKHNVNEPKSYPIDMTKEESTSNESKKLNATSSLVSNEFVGDSSVLKGNF